MQLARPAWKGLEVFGQLNNVNLKPINILLQFRFRGMCLTLNKRRKQHLFSVEETPHTFSSVKLQTGPYCMILRGKCETTNRKRTLVCSLVFKNVLVCQAASG